MRGNDLLRDIGYISDDLIEEAMEDSGAKEMSGSFRTRYHWQKWGSIAACVAVLGISAAMIWEHSNRQLEEISLTNESSHRDTVFQDNATIQENVAVSEDTDSLEDKAVPENIQEEAIQDYLVQKSDNAACNSATTSDETAKYTLITDFPPKQMDPRTEAESIGKEKTVFCYKAPDKGEYFYYQKLNEAIAYYCGQDLADTTPYAFQVVVDIFGDQIIPFAEGASGDEQGAQDDSGRLVYSVLNQSDDGKQLLEQEYQRLAEAGYQVQLSEDYILTGIFTKEELDNFQISQEYGYVFRFETE